jgi:hypothetical protein
MRKKAARARFLQQKLFEQAAKFRIMAAHPVEESGSAFRG